MKTAKIFKNGRSQAVRLPKEYRLSGDKVFIKRLGDGIVLLSEDCTWDILVDSTSRFSTDFMESRDQGAQQERGDLFE